MLIEGALFTFVAGLFAKMKPVGNVAVFAILTQGSSKDDVRYTAWTCAIACIVTLLIVTWGGNYVLAFFGISVDAVRAAGGIIVLLIGLNILANNNQHRHTDAETEDAKTRPEVGVVPRAIPIVAGPGTIATVLVAAQDRTWMGHIEISVVIVVLAVGLLFSMASRSRTLKFTIKARSAAK